MSVFRHERRVEFRDTDAAGIAHFTSLIAYMEEAEHAFLRHLGLSVSMPDPEGEISWPRVAVETSFSSAVRFEEVVDVQVRIVRLGQKSVTYGFSLSTSDRSIAVGSITAVCCLIRPNRRPESIVIPDRLREPLALWTQP